MSIFSLTFFIMYFSSLMVFVLKRSHLLLMLLGLESSLVSIYLGMFYFLSFVDYEFFFSMIYLTMSVCEGALSLAMLVLMIRIQGNDFILNFNSLW